MIGHLRDDSTPSEGKDFGNGSLTQFAALILRIDLNRHEPPIGLGF